MKRILLASTFVASFNAASAHADQVIADNLIVDGRLCAGPGCVSGEPFLTDDLRIKDGSPDLRFEDTSTDAADWYIDINGETDFFAIKNLETDTVPFQIDGGPPSNSLFIASDGDIGLGTSLPQAPLHLVDLVGEFQIPR